MPVPAKRGPSPENQPTIWEASLRPCETGMSRFSPRSTDPIRQGGRVAARGMYVQHNRSPVVRLVARRTDYAWRILRAERYAKLHTVVVQV